MKGIRQNAKKKAMLLGVVAGALLLAAYFGIVGALSGFGYATGRFLELWYLMVPLAVGFGLQVGLFSYIRNYSRMSGKMALGSGGASGVSMIACCVHHVTDVIPVLGVSALGLFLLGYQPALLAAGLVSNLIGILFMLNVAKKSKIRFRNGFLDVVVRHDSSTVLRTAVFAGIAVVLLVFLVVKPTTIPAATNVAAKLQALTNQNNSVTVSVAPIEFSPQSPEEFNVSMDTHTVQYQHDLMNTSTLLADGVAFSPTSWQSLSYMGGHHVRGTLSFGPIGKMPQNLTLVIRNVSGTDRVFRWNPTT